MCDRPRDPATIPRPRWGRLYAIVFVAAALLAAVTASVSAGVVRTAVGAAVATGAVGAAAWWVRANAAGLDLEAWCACASTTVTVRVYPARRAVPRRRRQRRRRGEAAGATLTA